MKINFLIATLVLSSSLGRSAAGSELKCRDLALKANLELIKLNGEEGGGPFNETSTRTEKGVTAIETYLFKNGIPSGYVNVRVTIDSLPEDETSQACTIAKLEWGA
jgi:hypothetical protein